MTCSHNVVFLLDVADSSEKILLHLGALRILNYLGCKFSLAKVRWDFKFFDSLGIQGRASRVGSFRELGSRSWEDFEEELEARFSNHLCTPHLPGPASRATVIRNILKETLLDYQWERPEIASPAKPVLRSQKNKLTLTVDNPPVCSAHEGFENAIFIFSPCPHSQRELWQFISGSYVHLSDELPPLHDLAEKFIPKGIREMMTNQKVTLYWVDTTEQSKLLESPDHIGYWRLVEQMCVLGGTILPPETLIRCLDHPRKGTIPSSEPSFIPRTQILPSDSSLKCLFSLPTSLQRSFLQLDGELILKADGREAWSCGVVLKPLTLSQRNFKGPINISLKYTMTGWSAAHASNLRTESWILCSESSGLSAHENSLFHQFVKCILAQRLHMVAEVSLSSGTGFPCTGILSPISGTAAVLSLLFTEQGGEAERPLLQTTMAQKFSKDKSFSLPEVVSYVLSQADDSGKAHHTSAESLFLEWAQQELSCTHGWSSAVLEDWYSLSNLCGASSHMMESFRKLQARSAQEEEEDPKSEMLLTSCLAKFYQKKASDVSLSSHQQNRRRRCVTPRTPVRQKMKTMPRSLQMLNVAMLNVKAQKSQPEGELPANEKSSQRLPSRRLDDKGEEKGRTMKTKIDFQTEEEMLSYITANYQKALMDKDLFACSQDMVTAVNVFQKSNEVACLDTIQSHLLKTSHALRQQLANEPAKETGIKECQLQVYLRLEMFSQCPSLQNCTDRMEQLVEETTELLRVLCWTKDPGYLTKFLEQVAEMYMESLPKTLGDLYYSLGTQIPPKLASVLPADFFSDDFITEESQTPSLPPSAASVPFSKTASLSTEADELEELRTRSAQKRKNPLARHRSVTEASQNLRQIEIPQAPRSCRKKDRSQVSLDVKLAPISKKTGMQEMTKVRRNLFNEDVLRPGKGSLPKIPRSHSVSAVEELKHKHSRANEGIRAHHKLLTKRVAETPLHKQISRRLLHRQITGRCSDPGSDVGIVEESPEKHTAIGLRRSPRIKELVKDKFLSKSFHSLEPKMSNTPKVHSLHLEEPKDQENQIGLPLPSVEAIPSPKSILFGKVIDEFSVGRVDSPRRRRRQLPSNEPVRQTSGKCHFQSPQRLLSGSSNTLRRSPRIQEKAQRTPTKAPTPKNTVAKCLGNLFSPCRQKSKSLPEFTEKEASSLTQRAQPKDRFSSTSKAAQLQTPDKQPQADVLDDVFVLLADGSGSAIPPSPYSELQSPRRSLRIAQKTTPVALAEIQSLEGRRNTSLEPILSRELDSPTPFKDQLPELCLSPNVRTLTEASASEVPCPLQPEGISASCNLTVKAMNPCLHSPTRGKLGRKSHIAEESPLKYQVVRETSSSSPSGSPEQHLNLCGHKGEQPCVDGTHLFAESSPFGKPGHAKGLSLGQKYKQTTDTMRPSERKGLEREVSPVLSFNSPVHTPCAVVVCEQLALSSLLNKSLSGSSQIDLDSKMSRSSSSSAEKAIDLQPALFPSSPRNDQPSLLAVPKSGSCAYALRCTPDRRQREAAARLEKVVTSDTSGATHSPPTYEVELEMQASGLPKLRIKRVASESGVVSGKPKGEARTLGDLSMAWCDKHLEKLEPVSISPPCVHSAHNTPRKFGVVGQTYICQSYSPVLCTSSTTSPSQGIIGVSCTPSPKHQGKVTPEAIKDWPRRKRATNGCNRSERPAEAVGEEPAQYASRRGAVELFSSKKVQLFGEAELEGVYKLQEQSPCSDTKADQDEGICREALCLESKKRVFEQISPEQKASQEMKRPCPVREDPGIAVYPTELLTMGKQTVSSASGLEDLFSFSDLTPPKSSGKGAISASGLRALTQSPLLYQGHPAPLKKCPAGDDLDMLGAVNEDSFLFHNAATRKRSITRTYSRKRLLH